MDPPPPARPSVRPLERGARETAVPRLASLLVDCVEGGGSVGFVLPFGSAEAERYWRGAAPAMDVLLVAGEGDQIDGTVSLRFATFPNAAHRAEVVKLLVRRSARGRGLARRLMEAAETAARSAGRTTLVLDTATGSDAEAIYRRLGWTIAGIVPSYCLMPDGTLNSTTFMYKLI